MAGVRVHEQQGLVLAAQFAKTVTSNLALLSVLAEGVIFCLGSRELEFNKSILSKPQIISFKASIYPIIA